LYVLTGLAKSILAMPEEEARDRLRDIDREVRASRRAAAPSEQETELAEEVLLIVEEPAASTWKEELLDRLHQLSPTGFEEFAIYLPKTFGMELTRVGGTGDEGIDGIGLAPLSPVLSTRVAVQAKRYDPATAVGREAVALFQRDASTAGAERAVLVTLGRFTAAARKAAIVSTPTVDLIDGDRLCDLVEEQEIGVRKVTQVNEAWFDRFD